MIFLDLFCGAGGAAMGLHRAFPDAVIIGIDNQPQPHYPFVFIQGDALNPPFDLSQFDFIWASPKCQAHTQLIHINKAQGRTIKHESQIADVHRLLKQSGKPYIIENVIGAPLENPIILRGKEFGLGVDRPRMFESNCLLFEPPAKRANRNSIAVYGRLDGRKVMGRLKKGIRDGTAVRAAKGLAEASAAMGIDWMDEYEITQAIPPAYSEYLIKQIFPNRD